MKTSLTFVILILLLNPCFGKVRGTTQTEFPTTGSVYETLTNLGSDTFFQIINEHKTSTESPKLNQEDWYEIGSLQMKSILPAGQQMGTQFYSPGATFIPFASQGSLIGASEAAIAKSPSWIRPKLSNVLLNLSPEKQTIWAGVINSAEDPYIDEIAFCVANSSIQYLNSSFAYPQLFVENAAKIYQISTELPYVQIINYGSSTSDPGYYSTTSYQKYNEDNQLVNIEVPRDIYYWYIVHPKLTDEIPAYIDPAIIENNSTHSNNITDPSAGHFWRSYLYEVQENDYPVLADTLRQVQTLFNQNGDANDAIHALQWWINQTMSFTSNAERPHQPVRIYRKHFGRCGEYADYTSAAARTALIPCTSILSMSTDHTWNEFWDEDWIMWEPVNGYINNPLVYEDGWGKVFGSVFEIRSDGYLQSVTGRYSSGLSTITLFVTDVNERPVDGARVILAFFEGGYKVDMVAFTDNNGLVTLPVGEGRSYFARIETSFGIYPPVAGTYSALAQDTVDGEDYYFQIGMDTAFPLPEVIELPIPQDDVQDWRFAIQYTVPDYYISGRVTWDDISTLGSYPVFYQEANGTGDVNMLLTDSDNVLFYQLMQYCDAYGYQFHSAAGEFEFDIPIGQDWYLFLDNSHRHGNAQYVEGLTVYQHYGVSVNDHYIPSKDLSINQIYPNPFNPSSAISFSLPRGGFTELAIYNIKGQKVKMLNSSVLAAGEHNMVWNGTDESGNKLASGIYFARLSQGTSSKTHKLILIK